MKATICYFNLAFCSFFLLIIFTPVAYASHPLITDDTGTQGDGKFQLEVNGQYDHNQETDNGVTIKETGSAMAVSMSYGMTDNVDVVLGIPYQLQSTSDGGERPSDENGLSDMSVAVKWMFHAQDGLSFAVKPGITLPTGDDEKGLGTGRTTYSAFFISTKQIEPWLFHLNLGYIRNENKTDAEKDLWHVSVASELEVVKSLRLVANLGMEKNPDRDASTNPAFILGGVIYEITDAFAIDCGYKYGFNKSETDYSILAGTTFKF